MVSTANFIITPFAVNTTAKNASSQIKTARPVSTRPVSPKLLLRMFPPSPRHEMILRYGGAGAGEIGGAKCQRGRARELSVDRRRHQQAHLAGLVGADRNQWLPGQVRFRADHVHLATSKSVDLDPDHARVSELVEHAHGVAVA